MRLLPCSKRFALVVAALAFCGWRHAGGGTLQVHVEGSAFGGVNGAYEYRRPGVFERQPCGDERQAAAGTPARLVHTGRGQWVLFDGDVSGLVGLPRFVVAEGAVAHTTDDAGMVPPLMGWKLASRAAQAPEVARAKARGRGAAPTRVSVHGWERPAPRHGHLHHDAGAPLLVHLRQRPATTLLLAINAFVAYTLFAKAQRINRSGNGGGNGGGSAAVAFNLPPAPTFATAGHGPALDLRISLLNFIGRER